jgi:hypothetical protein
MAQRKLHSAWQWLRRTVFRMKRKPDVYECKLREVFWKGDRELAIRVARVCVLFEDLRLEYIGSRATEDLPLDALSKQYRKFYFLRRSLVSLDEFCGALNRLNEVKAWKKYVESHDDKRRRKMWADAVKFFNAKKKRSRLSVGTSVAIFRKALRNGRSNGCTRTRQVRFRSITATRRPTQNCRSRPNSWRA